MAEASDLSESSSQELLASIIKSVHSQLRESYVASGEMFVFIIAYWYKPSLSMGSETTSLAPTDRLKHIN